MFDFFKKIINSRSKKNVVAISELTTFAATSTVAEQSKPNVKTGKSVLTFDAQKRVFIVKTQVARIALFNPIAKTFVRLDVHANEKLTQPLLDIEDYALPITGSWFTNEQYNFGIYVPALAKLFLLRQNELIPVAINAHQFNLVTYARMIPLSGYWFTKELESIALYDPVSALFFIKANGDSGSNDLVLQYGPPGNDMIPLVGDWHGTGTDSVGLYDNKSGVFLLKASIITENEADFTFHFGPPNSQYIPIVGDWQGTSRDKIALYSAQHGLFFFANQYIDPMQADTHCYFGPKHAHLLPLVGDWSGSGHDSIGVYDPLTGTAYLKYDCLGGEADEILQFSTFTPDSMPLTIHELN